MKNIKLCQINFGLELTKGLEKKKSCVCVCVIVHIYILLIRSNISIGYIN